MSIALINSYILDFIVTIQRSFFSAGYAAGRLTTTSSTNPPNQVATTLSTTESSGTNYVALWQATGDNSATTSDFRATLVETSVRQQLLIEPQDATDALAVGGIYAYSSNGTGKSFVVNYGSEAATAGIAGRALNVLALDANDKWQYNSGSVTTGNLVSITLDAGVEYVVIASCMVSANANCDVLYDAVSYGALGNSMSQDGTTYSPYYHIVKLIGNGTAVSIRRLAGTIRQGSIVALRTDKFENAYYAEDPAQTATTSSSFVTGLSNTFSIVNPGNYHLVIGNAQVQSSATNSSAGAKLVNASRNINYNVAHFRENNSTTEWYPTPVARITSFVDPTPTLEWQFYSEGSNTARLTHQAIAIFDLGTPAPPIYFVGSTTGVNTDSVAITDQAEEGDIVVVASHSTGALVNTPTGYTSIENSNQNTVFYQSSYKIMGAVPDSTVDGLTNRADTKHIVMVFRYVDTTTPIEQTPVTTAGSTGAPDPGGPLTLGSKAIVLLIGYLDDDNVLVDVTAPAGYTICGVEQANGTVMAAYSVFDTPGIIGNPPAFGVGLGTDAWVAQTIPLKLA